MKATIDSAGRVVIPKALRDRAGLKAGDELDLRYSDGLIEIIPPPPPGRLVRENGFLVWEPAPGSREVTPEEINEAIRQLREERSDF